MVAIKRKIKDSSSTKSLHFIFFREAFEASMLCSLLLAYLTAIGQRHRYKDVYIGIAAVIVSIVSGVTAYLTIQNFEGSAVFQIKGFSYILACGMLTYMAFSIKKSSDTSTELHSKIESVIEKRSRFAISGFVFLTIFREVIEILVFLMPLTVITNPILNVVQGILGIVIGVICDTRFIYLVKTLKHFFNIFSFLLVIFAAGFLLGGIGQFQHLGWLPFGDKTLWDTTSMISSESPLGYLLEALFGYTDKPTYLEGSVYLLYLSTVGILTAYRRR
jgi:high-affinity iron transporter